MATTAGEGHFGPLVPFARSLIDAGHEVRVAAPASFAPVVRKAGLEHAPFADAPPEELGAVFARVPELPRAEANATVIREVFGRCNTRAALPGVRDTIDTWRPDLVLREPAEFASYVVADALGVPHVQVAIGLAALDEFFLSLVDEPLREFGCASGAAGLRAAPRLTSVPERLDTEPAPGTAEPHRFRSADPASDPVALPSWWPDDDLPLVYVSFGSITGRLATLGDLYQGALSSLASLPVRVLLTVGEGVDHGALAPLPPNVHVERWWPQQEVMPHTSAMVGHGGFGTTMLGLAAGVPMVVLPLFSSDQFLNAARVQEVGAGIALEDGAPAVEALGGAVQRLLDDPSYAVVAGQIAQDIAGLPPAAASVPLLEQAAAG
ncbi:MAG: glycosyltransferase family 1 protein [Sporichthyaceae bacterium]|nr:glycosyltransferase family 1 protein [Sporichthyaceae bacterium]